MNLSPTAQATLLLTCYFSKASSEDAKPLTTAEWGRFALWLKEKSTTPADLLVTEPKALLSGWHDSRVSEERILKLLSRGHSLALAVEKWQRAGLWVVTRSDPEYPWRLKQRLKTDSPPVLFGCGSKALLNAGGLAVIGSRNANELDLKFTEQVGAKSASEGIPVVSGGARGVDETAMLGAMHSGGLVIGVMADSLLKAATSVKWRRGLMDGNVVLVSPFYPEAGFNAGNAMARNKYIYCLADSALVIHSGKTGGTLNGAEENLKKSWIPLWVKPTVDEGAANANLVSKGGHWCEADIQSLNVSDLLVPKNNSNHPSHLVQPVKEVQVDLFSSQAQPELFASEKVESVTTMGEEASFEMRHTSESLDVEAFNLLSEKAQAEPVDFYQLFVGEINRLARNPVTLDELIEVTALNKSQLTDWLTRATNENVIQKLSRPARYQSVKNK